MRIAPLFAVAVLLLVPAALAGDEADPEAIALKFTSESPAERAAAEKAIAEADAPLLRRVLAAMREQLWTPGHGEEPAPAPEGTTLITAEARFLEVDLAAARRLGLLDASGAVATRVLTEEQAQQLMNATEAEGVKTLSAPRITAFDRQKANISVVNSVSFIQDYDVQEAKDGTKIADPIIGTIQDGVVVDFRAIVSADKSWITCDLTVSVARIDRPIKEFQTNVGGHPVSIQIPEVHVTKHGAAVTLPPGGTALIDAGRDFAEGGRLVVVLLRADL